MEEDRNGDIVVVDFFFGAGRCRLEEEMEEDGRKNFDGDEAVGEGRGDGLEWDGVFREELVD